MKTLIYVLIIALLMGCSTSTAPEIVEAEKEFLNLSGNQSLSWEFLEGESAEHVILTGSSIDSAGLYWVSKIKGMKKLSLDDCDNITSFEELAGLDIEFLDVDSCDSVKSFPFGDMKNLKHLEAGYCWNALQNNYAAYTFVDSINLEFLGVGFVGYTGNDHMAGLDAGDTLAGGSVDDSLYCIDSLKVVYINESVNAQAWYNAKKAQK